MEAPFQVLWIQTQRLAGIGQCGNRIDALLGGRAALCVGIGIARIGKNRGRLPSDLFPRFIKVDDPHQVRSGRFRSSKQLV